MYAVVITVPTNWHRSAASGRPFSLVYRRLSIVSSHLSSRRSARFSNCGRPAFARYYPHDHPGSIRRFMLGPAWASLVARPRRTPPEAPCTP